MVTATANSKKISQNDRAFDAPIIYSFFFYTRNPALRRRVVQFDVFLERAQFASKEPVPSVVEGILASRAKPRVFAAHEPRVWLASLSKLHHYPQQTSATNLAEFWCFRHIEGFGFPFRANSRTKVIA
jgi:hypothetical protein